MHDCMFLIFIFGHEQRSNYKVSKNIDLDTCSFYSNKTCRGQLSQKS